MPVLQIVPTLLWMLALFGWPLVFGLGVVVGAASPSSWSVSHGRRSPEAPHPGYIAPSPAPEPRVAILKVAQMGHPILRRVADPIDPSQIGTPAFERTCEDLLETMDAYDGAGLAAPQVHLSVRLVVLTLDPGEGPEVWANPELTALTEEHAWSYEGCLSVEGMRGRVARPPLLHVRFIDRAGADRAYILQGFPAVVAQHECDHLDGVLYIDRADPRTISFMAEYRRFGPMHHALAALDGQDPDEVEAQDDRDQDRWPDAVIEIAPTLSPGDALALAAPHLELAVEE